MIRSRRDAGLILNLGWPDYPLAQIAFDVVTYSGEVQHWMGAVTAPNKLARAGWTKSTLKPGDEIDLSGRRGWHNAQAMDVN